MGSKSSEAADLILHEAELARIMPIQFFSFLSNVCSCFQSSRSSSSDRSSPSLLNALATAAAARSSTRRNASKDTEFDSSVSPRSAASSASGSLKSSLLTPSQTLLMMSEVAMRKSKARHGYRSGSDGNGSSEGDAETQVCNRAAAALYVSPRPHAIARLFGHESMLVHSP